MSHIKPSSTPSTEATEELGRLNRSPSLLEQVESVVREAIAARRFADDRLPTEMELAEQRGVSRETVRRATEVLKREGLLVKYRRKGTFIAARMRALAFPDVPPCLGYLQARYDAGRANEEAVCRSIDGAILQGAIDEAGSHGMTLLVQHLPPSGGREAIQNLVGRATLDGMIIASCGDEKLIRSTMGRGVPLVLVDHDFHAARVSTVRDDSYEGGRLAVAHLAGLGHRRIAYFNWRNADLNPWRARGYRQGLRDARLPRRREWELFAEINPAGTADAVECFLALDPRPTALFCFNNTLARLVIEELARKAIRVPDDVSVVGAGGEEVPGLTCTVIDWRAMGRAVVEILRRQLADKGRKPEHRLFPHSLNAGRTTSTPAT